MRVGSRSMQLQFLASLARQQERLTSLQQQVASGKKVSTAGDNPAAAVQIVALQNSLEQMNGFESNSGLARGRLSLEEQALNSTVGSLQRIRDLVIDARAPGRTEVEFRLIAAEIEELSEGLLATANSQDGEGRYLFAGNSVQTRPFSATAGGVAYSGDQGVRTQRISESRVVQEGDSGAEVFGRIRSGNGTFNVLHAGTNAGGVFYSNTTVTDGSAWDHQQYVINFTAPDTYEVRDGAGTLVASGAYESGDSIEFSGIAVSFEGVAAAGDSFTIEPSRYQSVFQTVDALLSTLGSAVLTDAQQAEFQSNTNSALLNLDRALDHISEVRGHVGQRLSVLDEQQEANDRVSIEIQSVLSRTQDTDLASLISELEAQSIALEAAQRSYARLQGQSLFDLI